MSYPNDLNHGADHLGAESRALMRSIRNHVRPVEKHSVTKEEATQLKRDIQKVADRARAVGAQIRRQRRQQSDARQFGS